MSVGSTMTVIFQKEQLLTDLPPDERKKILDISYFI